MNNRPKYPDHVDEPEAKRWSAEQDRAHAELVARLTAGLPEWQARWLTLKLGWSRR
jgi:hypothetical protein